MTHHIKAEENQPHKLSSDLHKYTAAHMPLPYFTLIYTHTIISIIINIEV